MGGMTRPHAFSYTVGTAFEGKGVTATMKQRPNGEMKIKYVCHAYQLEMAPQDFVWSEEALAFKKSFGQQGNGEYGLSEEIALAFLNVVESRNEA